MTNITLFGEVLIDLISTDRTNFVASPGGSIFNTAITLQRMGINTKFYSKIGNDFWGNYLKEYLVDNNFDIDTSYTTLKEKTPLAFAILDNQKNARYDFYKSIKQEPIKIKEFSQIEHTSFFHFGSFFSTLKENHNIIKRFFRHSRKNNFIISYDPNFRKKFSKNSITNIFTNMKHSHIIKCSIEDIQNIFSKTLQQKTSLQEAFKELEKFNPILSIITLGKKGSAAKIIGKPIVLVPAKHQDKIVSSIGAGDNFSAGYLFYLFRNNIDTIQEILDMNENTIRQMLHFSTKLATLSLTQSSAIIDDTQLQRFICDNYKIEK